MKLNQAGVDLIKSFEKCRLEAYPDPVSGGDPWTIGWGHTGPDIKKGVVWTQEDADARFEKDLDRVVKYLRSIVRSSLTDNQFSACVSLCYNVGSGNFVTSTLLRLLNSYHLDAAGEEFTRWDKVHGKEVQGLLNRRLAEQKLFRS